MKKLWQKDWILDETIEAFETKGDLVMDQKLIGYDIYGSLAHAHMLTAISILQKQEFSKLKHELLNLLDLYDGGKLKLQLGDEDMHTKIETALTATLGSIGKKIHTGRSRNDQIITALRLYTKEKILEIGLATTQVASAFLLFAKKYEFVPMPGYTHMQKAMPSSVGMWAGSFVESLLDDLEILKNALGLVDQSPLGSGAGYGIPLPLKRGVTAKLLGFSKVQNNSLYCQNSRGKMEAAVVGALLQLLMTINKFASDLMLFTTSEFGYFQVVDTLVTGSSIMPQKKNIDVAELLRSKVHIVLGNYTVIVSLASNLPSGYNRDFQDLKKPLVESIELTQSCLNIVILLLQNILPNEDQLAIAMTPELFATHAALEKVATGTPFRTAYQETAKEIGEFKKMEKPEVMSALKQSAHIGGTANLGLESLKKTILKESAHWKNMKKIFDGALESLKGGE